MNFFVKWTSDTVERCFTMGLGYCSWSSAWPWTTSESRVSFVQRLIFVLLSYFIPAPHLCYCLWSWVVRVLIVLMIKTRSWRERSSQDLFWNAWVGWNFMLLILVRLGFVFGFLKFCLLFNFVWGFYLVGFWVLSLFHNS